MGSGEFVKCLLQRPRLAGRYADLGAFGDQSVGDSKTDAATGPGDESDLA